MQRTTARAVARFGVGTAHQYLLTRRRTRTRGADESAGESRIRFRVESLSKDPGGYLLEWTYEEVAGAGADGNHPLVAAVREMTQGLSFRYRASAHGKYRGLIEPQAVHARIEALAARVSSTLPPAVRAAIDATLSSEIFQGHSLRDVPLLHGAYGLSLPWQGTALRSARVGHPLGGAPLPATERLGHSVSGTRQTFTVERLFDPERLVASMVERLTAMATLLGRPGPGPGEITEVLLVDKAVYELEGGWPARLTFDRESFMTARGETAGQTESILVERVA